jgi:hypothetical protein
MALPCGLKGHLNPFSPGGQVGLSCSGSGRDGSAGLVATICTSSALPAITAAITTMVVMSAVVVLRTWPLTEVICMTAVVKYEPPLVTAKAFHPAIKIL